MFRLFSSIFGKSDTPLPGGINETLVQEAIERIVDSTDPRMRILPDYRRALREPAIRAIEHVIALVRQLDVPVTATAEGREQSPTLGVLFTSATRMQEILALDSTLRDYLATPPCSTTAFGLLVAQRNEKTAFGYALVDDQLMNDVQQTTVSFDEHRLLDLTSSEQETRRLLMRRAFDYLLSMALQRVTEQRDEREKLTQQRALLRVKLDILQRGGSGFSRDMGQQDRTALQARLDEVETQLAALGPVHEILQGNLSTVVQVLTEPGQHLWGDTASLRIDKRFVLHGADDDSVPAIALQDLHDSTGRQLTVQLVSIDLSLFPGQPAAANNFPDS